MKIKDILESVIKPRSNGEMKNIETQKILFSTYSDDVIKHILKKSRDSFEISMAKQTAEKRKTATNDEIKELLDLNPQWNKLKNVFKTQR